MDTNTHGHTHGQSYFLSSSSELKNLIHPWKPPFKEDFRGNFIGNKSENWFWTRTPKSDWKIGTRPWIWNYGLGMTRNATKSLFGVFVLMHDFFRHNCILYIISQKVVETFFLSWIAKKCLIKGKVRKNKRSIILKKNNIKSSLKLTLLKEKGPKDNNHHHIWLGFVRLEFCVVFLFGILSIIS